MGVGEPMTEHTNVILIIFKVSLLIIATHPTFHGNKNKSEILNSSDKKEFQRGIFFK